MPRSRYSAKVDLRLIVGEIVFALAQVGPSHAILTDPASMPPCEAKIEIVVNDKVSTTLTVFLPHGIRPESTRIDYF